MLADLADIPVEYLDAAAIELRRTSDYFPSVAQLRTAAIDRMLDLPSETEGLAQIEARIHWARQPEDTRGPAPFVHDLVVEALEYAGGYHELRTTDRPGVFRGQFVNFYRDIRTRALHAARTGPVSLSAATSRKELEPATEPSGILMHQ